MKIKLVRHGQSEANANGYQNGAVADSSIWLTALGREQAFNTGVKLGAEFINNSIVYCSPYVRAKQTAELLLFGADTVAPCFYEDPRLREMDHGYSSFESQEDRWKLHGQFYYRFDGGESPADCFDRVSSFIDSMFRQSDRKKKENILIVAHGITIRCFVARFFHMTVDEYSRIANPKNASIITIAPKDEIECPFYGRGRWAVEGLKWYTERT